MRPISLKNESMQHLLPWPNHNTYKLWDILYSRTGFIETNLFKQFYWSPSINELVSKIIQCKTRKEKPPPIHKSLTFLGIFSLIETFSNISLKLKRYRVSPKKWPDFTMSYLQKYWIWRLQIFYSNLAWVEILYWKILCDHLNPFKLCMYLKISKF